MPSAACDWSSDVCSTSEEHTSELQPHSEISYAVFCLKKKKIQSILSSDGKILFRSSWPIRPLVMQMMAIFRSCFFFFNDTATTEIYTNLNTLSLHDALPI